MKFRNRNESVLNSSKVTTLFSRMRDRLATREGGTLTDALSSLYAMFEQFFTSLGKPLFKAKKLKVGDEANPDVYNDMLNNLQHDIETCFSETKVAGDLVVDTFNASQIATLELVQRSTEAASKITDLRLLAGQLDQNVIIAGDDFQTTDRIDTAFPLQNAAAEIRVREGIVTLPRIESVRVVDENTRVVVSPVQPIGANTVPTTDNTNRIYEGNFFDFMGKARPEGGSFHLEERLSPNAAEYAEGDSDILFYDLNDNISVFDEAIDQRPLDNPTDADAEIIAGETPGQTTEERQIGLPLRTEDILIIDRGANTEEKNFVRTNMVDGNPDTFWEVEYVVNAESIQAFASSLTTEGGIRDITPAQLRAKAVGVDSLRNLDLEVQITLELSEDVPVNWISINPMNFGEMAWLEVTEVSTAEDAQSGFTPIEEFDQNRFANVITNEANEELQDETVSDILAPSRFAFRGTAVYTFPVRTAKFIRISLKQRVPVPDPYQRMAIQLNRTISNVQSYSRSGGGKK